MRKYKISAEIAISTFALLLVLPCYSANNVNMGLLPSRSDCISEVNFGTSSFTRTTWSNLTSSINKEFLAKNFIEQFPYVAQLAIPFSESTNGHSMYIQYLGQCSEKSEMTKVLMAYFAKKINGFPDYSILNKRVDPNPQTIDTCGKYWVDCDSKK